MVYLNRQHNNKLLKVHNIAEDCDIPIQYLAKIVQKLRQRGMLYSIRGPAGGVKIRKNPEDITLKDIIAAVGEVHASADICIMGHKTCDENPECVLHPIWKRIREDIHEGIESKSLKDIENLRINT